MLDDITYSNCPYCSSSLISVTKDFQKKVITVKCENNEECGCVIDRQSIKEEQDG